MDQTIVLIICIAAYLLVVAMLERLLGEKGVNPWVTFLWPVTLTMIVLFLVAAIVTWPFVKLSRFHSVAVERENMKAAFERFSKGQARHRYGHMQVVTLFGSVTVFIVWSGRRRNAEEKAEYSRIERDDERRVKPREECGFCNVKKSATYYQPSEKDRTLYGFEKDWVYSNLNTAKLEWPGVTEWVVVKPEKSSLGLFVVKDCPYDHAVPEEDEA